MTKHRESQYLFLREKEQKDLILLDLKKDKASKSEINKGIKSYYGQIRIDDT